MIYKLFDLTAPGRPGEPVKDREKFLYLRTLNAVLLRRVRNFDLPKEERDKSKKQLVAFIYGGTPDENGCFKGRKENYSQKLVADYDKIPDEYMPTIEQRVKELKDRCQILFAERSASCNGVHIVFRGNPQLSVEENLQWLTDQIGIDGVEYDTNCTDAGRVLFSTSNTPEDLWILDDALFEESREVKYADSPMANPPYAPVLSVGKISAPETGTGYPTEYNGIPYARIVEGLLNAFGGIPQEGDRNNTYFKMSCQLLKICDRKADWVFSLIPDFGLSADERWSAVTSASREPHSAVNGILKKVLIGLSADSAKGDCLSADCPPPMPKKLPKLIRLLTKNTPEIYKPAVAQAIFPALASHLYNVKIQYIDGTEHEASLMNVLIAETGAGKSCINLPINLIMEDIVERDKVNREREAAWKKENKKRSQNKDKESRPEDLVIQHVQPDMTNAAFIQRMKEADGHFLYTRMNEIEQLLKLGSGVSKDAWSTIIRLAFDQDGEYGAERVGDQSVCETVDVRFNFNASTTPGTAKSFFRNHLVNGTLQRLNVCTIPPQPIGSEMPKYGNHDVREELKPYIDRLNNASGKFSVKSVLDFTKELYDGTRVDCIDRQDNVYQNFTYRGLKIAHTKASVLYIAEGCGRFTQEMKEFIRWSLDYDLWCKMHFFGEDVRSASSHDNYEVKRKGPKSLHECLPTEFTVDELKKLVSEKNAETSAPKLIKAWKYRKLILPVDGKKDTYRKVG